MNVFVLNGPNLNLLGSREPEVYGSLDLRTLEATLSKRASELGVDISTRQTNSEEVLIGWIHEAYQQGAPVILNPAAFTHYSYALRDACLAHTQAGHKLIEVHISNPHAREAFRQHSVISGAATGVIAGFGFDSYLLALEQLARN
jgi:3-dehydroquinate dehydratase-2